MNRGVAGTLQVSCVQMHWARPLAENLARTLRYVGAAARAGSRVVLFPEASLTGYYFPDLVRLDGDEVRAALDQTRESASTHGIYVIAGTIQRAGEKFLNVAHVIGPDGGIVHEYAKVHMAGRDERTFCRGGDRLAFFEIDAVPCTLVICRDGRHPELYRLPAMAGAQILFHPSCSSDEIEAVTWKRTSGRAQQPAGPTTGIFHCVANTVGQAPDGRQTSSGASFVRDPRGLPLAEAGWYQEEMISAVLDLASADRGYALASLETPAFLKPHWERMIEEMKTRAADPVPLPGRSMRS